MNEHVRRELEPPALLLSRGSLGPDVTHLQEWLCLNGFHVAVDGDFGPATEAAVKAFQQQYDGEYDIHIANADGLAGSKTWRALTDPMRRVVEWERDPPLSTGAEIVACARAHLAAQPSEAGKPNGGPWVRLYCRGQEVSWCAGFATTVLGQAFGHDDWYTLSCDELAALAKRRGLFLRADLRRAVPTMQVRPGDLFLIRRVVEEGSIMNDWVHTGIVTAVGDGYFETVEGNTNTDGSREGTAVHARVRAFRPNVDFVLTGGDR